MKKGCPKKPEEKIPMPLPKQHEIRRPLLEYVNQYGQVRMGDALEAMATYFNLDKEEREELLPNGRSKRFDNRVQWSKLGLAAAKLLDTPQRGVWRITEIGKQALKKPGEINRNFLMQYPDYAEWVNKESNSERKGFQSDDSPQGEIIQNSTPEELLEESYQTIRVALAQELLDKIKNSSPRFFEQLVVDLLVAMGYGGSQKDAGEAVGQTGDGGIDGIIKEDKLGLDIIYIQAKRWQNPVGRPEVQSFAGSLEGHRAKKGVFITTSKFNQNAKDYVEKIEKKIILIDGDSLAYFMIDHNVGVSETAKYITKKVDHDYFDSE